METCATCSQPVDAPIWHEAAAYHERCLPSVPLAVAWDSMCRNIRPHGALLGRIFPGRQTTAPKILRSKDR